MDLDSIIILILFKNLNIDSGVAPRNSLDLSSIALQCVECAVSTQVLNRAGALSTEYGSKFVRQDMKQSWISTLQREVQYIMLLRALLQAM